MKFIPRPQILNKLRAYVGKNKVAVIYGPRRCGKTTLLRTYLESRSKDYLLVSGEDITVREYLSSQSVDKLRSFVGGVKLLAVDEAQKISQIGLNLKLIVDHIPGIRVIATGSSSFDLARHVGEPLTGRKMTILMFPLAQMELAGVETRHETDARVEERLIYGSYPEVVTHRDNRKRAEYLREIVSSYLCKDILELEGLRQSAKILRLLQLLAFQIGHEVSVAELGTQLGMSKNTVDKYLDLLEKAFVIYRVQGFSRNLRKEIVKNARYYFLDVGVRNALINNFNPLKLRDDLGMVWENYVVAERLKTQAYTGMQVNNYFWRTYDRKEIDWVEERRGALRAFEIKWNMGKGQCPKDWRVAYPNASYRVIHRENYLSFIT